MEPHGGLGSVSSYLRPFNVRLSALAILSEFTCSQSASHRGHHHLCRRRHLVRVFSGWRERNKRRVAQASAKAPSAATAAHPMALPANRGFA
jgi:hypothetical protein